MGTGRAGADEVALWRKDCRQVAVLVPMSLQHVSQLRHGVITPAMIFTTCGFAGQETAIIQVALILGIVPTLSPSSSLFSRIGAGLPILASLFVPARVSGRWNIARSSFLISQLEAAGGIDAFSLASSQQGATALPPCLLVTNVIFTHRLFRCLPQRVLSGHMAGGTFQWLMNFGHNWIPVGPAVL